jgi:hypothetical protein
VIDVIKRPTTFKDPFQLAKVADIAACIKWHLDVSPQTKADLVRLVMKIAGNYMMPTLTELRD